MVDGRREQCSVWRGCSRVDTLPLIHPLTLTHATRPGGHKLHIHGTAVRRHLDESESVIGLALHQR